ncbi:flagellin [Sporosarcina sp. Sa2YVA2]|uniref:Flagellin n=1 Tax=Sporosarcina quadrami TaxID=2762234 RepID=A0ABR8UAX7_9BACL|nr:flagellin [Sporosarcina quadrami]MBD7985179.1 flagellin [Sporosarcina quadrami]
MIINHNIAALNTHRQLGSNNAQASKNLEKLSSGLQINRAGDDAAGLAISEKMRGQIRGLDMAAKNSQDGISLIQTAEGALNETHDILQRMRELATQAANDTNTSSDRGEIQKEINSLTSEINRIGNTTEFNTQKLINGDKSLEYTGTSSMAVDLTGMSGGSITVMGKQIDFDTNIADTGAAIVAAINGDTSLGERFTASFTGSTVSIVTDTNASSVGMTASITSATGVAASAVTITEGASTDTKALNFQIGANENQGMKLDITDMRASALGITTAGTAGGSLGVTDGTNSIVTEQALDVSTHDKAASAVTKIQTAIDIVSGERSKLGATQNRLEHTINNLGTSSENLTAAESRIRDVDYVLSAA